MDVLIKDIKKYFSTKLNAEKKISVVDTILGGFIKKSEPVSKSFVTIRYGSFNVWEEAQVQIGDRPVTFDENPLVSKYLRTVLQNGQFTGLLRKVNSLCSFGISKVCFKKKYQN